MSEAWKCPLCAERNTKNVVRCKCGYDKSQDYGRYPTFSNLSEEEKQKYNQRMIKKPIVETEKNSLIENIWQEWTKSVQKELGSLEPKVGDKLISKMKDYYQILIKDAHLESQKIRKEKVKPVFVNTYSREDDTDLKFHQKKVTYRGSLATTWVIGETDESVCAFNPHTSGLSTEAKRQNFEGNCWYFGKRGKKDYKKAIEHYKDAIRLGDVSALNNLGNCYYFGNGVTKNDELAIEYYRKGAEKMHPAATFNLAYCYLTGIGTKRNKELANTLYERAAMYEQIEQRNR